MSAPDFIVRMLGPGDHAVLEHVAPEVFDNPPDARWSQEFLADARHHLAVALADGQVVGMASGVHHVHPDKPPELWINEVGVTPAHRRQGIARRLLQALFERAQALGCAEAWVTTEVTNGPARNLYAAAGGQEAGVVIVSFRLGGTSRE
jgi:ribosomal protein S18 acetylase RimI-like enzyme